jgi:hypothetical protein
LNGFGIRTLDRSHAFCFACLAALGFVLELFVVKEKLLAGREDKIITAVDALEASILEFHWSTTRKSLARDWVNQPAQPTISEGHRLSVLMDSPESVQIR